MKKCKWKTGIIIALAATLVFSYSCPKKVYAADSVEWNTDDEGNETYPKKVVIKPYTYSELPSDVGVNKELNDDGLAKVSKKVINDWAPIAYYIFLWGRNEGGNKSGVTANWYDGKWEDYFNNEDDDEDAAIDLELWLKKTSGGEKGGPKADHSVATGMRHCNSLSSMREDVASEISNALDSEDIFTDELLDQSGGDDGALHELNDSTNTTVFYNLVTQIDKIGANKMYMYNTYGIAVYDFQLAPIVDPQLPYKDAVSMPDPNSSNGGYEASSYSENQSDKESEITMEIEDATTQTVNNSITQTESFSITETIGNEFQFGLETSFFKDVLSVEVSSTQTMETSRTTDKGLETTVSNNLSAGVTLPPHSAVEIIQKITNNTTITNYTCPVALRYKVAIFSMSGYTYWNGSSYVYSGTHSNFSTIFGNGDEKGGFGAPENLYLRAVKSIDGDHFDVSNDRVYGKVHGWYNNDQIVTKLDWPCIRGYSNGRVVPYINNCSTNIPLFGQGASLKVTIDGKQTIIGQIFPLYMLKSIRVDEGDSEFDISYNDSLDLNSIAINGYDEADIPFYGFKPDRGGWILCDENGDEITSSNVAEIVTDSRTGKNELKAKSLGTVYLKWVLDDKISYVSIKDGKKVSATENVPEYPYIKVNVTEPPADLTDYRIEFKNNEASVLVDEELDLNDALKASVYDSRDILHSHDVVFVSKDMKDSRLNITTAGEFEDGIFKATEAGDYYVFAEYRNNGQKIQSDFAKIKVLPKRELKYLEVTNPEDEKITNTVTSCSYDLPTYVKYMDNYDEEWTGDKPALSFKLPDEVTDEEAEIDADGKLTVYKGGTYDVTVSAAGLEDKVITVFVNALGELTIADEADPAVLEAFIFNDFDNGVDNKVDFSGLTVTGKGLDGQDWDMNDSDITWVVDDVEITGSEYEVPADGTYTVKAKSGDVESNELSVEVKEERKLDKLVLSGDITTDGLGIGEVGYPIDLSQNTKDVAVTGYDQYGEAYDPYAKGIALKWTADDDYSKIENDTTLVGVAKGNGWIYVSTDDDSIKSEKLEFNVWLKPYVTELYADDGGLIREEEVFDLSQLNARAKDQNGDIFQLNDAEKATLEWEVTDLGTIKGSSGNVELDKVNKTIKVNEWTLKYGQTGSVVLSASYMNLNGKPVTGRTTIQVRQKPILDKLVLSLKSKEAKAVVPVEDVSLTRDMFDIAGIDQYEEDYDLTNETLTYNSDNAQFKLDNPSDMNKCKLTSGPSGTSANITVTNTNYLNKEVVSNKITVSTPKVRKMKTLEFTNVPEVLAFGRNFDMLSLGATCYDEDHEAYTPADVTAYPAKINYSMEKGDTDSEFDTAKNILTAGTNKRAYVTVFGYAVNADTTERKITDASGKTIETNTEIWVGPMIKEIKASDTVFHVKGGKVTITFNGLALENGIEVKLLDKSGKEVQTASSTGTDKAQTVEFTLADNKSLTEPAQYTISYTVCGDPEGSDEFAPKSNIKLVVENHKLRKIERKEATCEVDGNIEYWICDTCKKLFKDEKATEEIKLEDTVLKAPGHVWDDGVITKEATVDEDGEKTFTCTTCNETRIEAVPKLKQTSGTMLCTLKAKGKTSLELTWTEIKGADGYDIFFGRCNHNGKSSSAKLVGSVDAGGKLKYTAKGLKKGKEYKAYVQAYIYGNEKKIYVTDCELVHAYTGNYTKDYTNPKSITVKKANVKLKKGKTFTIKAKVNKVKKGKKLMPSGHAPSLRYVSSDPSIAKVSKKGKITAVAKGKCTIYVYTVNGIRKAVKVTVK